MLSFCLFFICFVLLSLEIRVFFGSLGYPKTLDQADIKVRKIYLPLPRRYWG